MQSLESLRLLATVDRVLIEEQAMSFARFRGQSDPSKLMSLLSPNAVFTIPGDATLLSCVGRYEGSAAILRFFAHCHIDYEILKLKVLDALVDGDRAAVRSSCVLRHRGTGLARALNICDILRFENGLIVDVFSYMDTLAIASIYGD
jgi:ketosteroid isomerase-like protein